MYIYIHTYIHTYIRAYFAGWLGIHSWPAPSEINDHRKEAATVVVLHLQVRIIILGVISPLFEEL